MMAVVKLARAVQVERSPPAKEQNPDIEVAGAA